MIEVVVNHKTTKFESNSQHSMFINSLVYRLLSITKLQNLKAIHNVSTYTYEQVFVVVNHKTTKFESNSQPTLIGVFLECCCCQSQNYKI